MYIKTATILLTLAASFYGAFFYFQDFLVGAVPDLLKCARCGHAPVRTLGPPPLPEST